MRPRLEILPPAQLKLWPLLKSVPLGFVLYGGTAIALQLGHRQSVDFDFFSAASLQKEALLQSLPFLAEAKLVHPEINTLNCNVLVDEGYVKLQFLAGLAHRQGRVDDLLVCEDNGVRVASLRDLLATKLNTIQMRAEIKDYVDISAIIDCGIGLAEGLGCARAIFGQNFDFGTSIRALCSYRDGDLSELPKAIKEKLTTAALAVEDVPTICKISETI